MTSLLPDFKNGDVAGKLEYRKGLVEVGRSDDRKLFYNVRCVYRLGCNLSPPILYKF